MRLDNAKQLRWAGLILSVRFSMWSQYDTPSQPSTESLSSLWRAQYRPATVGRKTERRGRGEKMMATEGTMALVSGHMKYASGWSCTVCCSRHALLQCVNEYCFTLSLINLRSHKNCMYSRANYNSEGADWHYKSYFDWTWMWLVMVDRSANRCWYSSPGPLCSYCTASPVLVLSNEGSILVSCWRGVF